MLQRAVAISIVAHVIMVVLIGVVHEPHDRARVETIDVEVAPPAPEVQALPPEVARLPEEDLAGRTDETDPSAAATIPPPPEEGFAIDAGVDAVPDASIDAAIDASIDASPDAAIDASVDAAPEPLATPDAGVDPKPDAAEDTMLALGDAGVPDATGDADVTAGLGDAGATGDATQVAAAEGSGSAAAGSGAGSGSGAGEASIALEAGSGSGAPGQFDEPAVAGAATGAGTAANLLTYFRQGHVVTALIRFDRLRGTEWAAQTERLLRPMPDYQVLFGAHDAKIADKLETLVISTPSPKDAAATTLVARTALGRPALRDFLGKQAPVTWSTAKIGLLGTRPRPRIPNDKRVFVSPFRGWFLLAQPGDLGGLTTAAPGNVDSIQATGRLPAWLGNIRSIEKETGEGALGPALVVTLGLGGAPVDLTGNDFGLGITKVPTPDRVSLAMELVKQGWIVHGNMRFASQKDAIEFITVADTVKERVADSRAIQMVLGKQLVNAVNNLSFARTGGRVSYATSISIADARAILSATAQQLDAYFGRP